MTDEQRAAVEYVRNHFFSQHPEMHIGKAINTILSALESAEAKNERMKRAGDEMAEVSNHAGVVERWREATQ